MNWGLYQSTPADQWGWAGCIGFSWGLLNKARPMRRNVYQHFFGRNMREQADLGPKAAGAFHMHRGEHHDLLSPEDVFLLFSGKLSNSNRRIKFAPAASLLRIRRFTSVRSIAWSASS